MIGQTLDHYRIESKIGEGGMGVVYKAHDSHLNRTVAIKILPPDKVADPIRKHRFVQEAKAASALNHPNIVTIHDIRSDQGVDFIVMECIQGKTLDKLVPPKGLKSVQALTYAVQIADALAKAHGAGILHRDLKPANVMIAEDGRVKVLDFGLAKLVESSTSPDDSTLTASALTYDGVLVGTPAYMSPEQAQSGKLDARSDIFSFGSVIYEMVTGQKPFPGDSHFCVISKIVNEDPIPPRRLCVAISPDLERLIVRCLRKDPARRYQTMADLKVALQDMEEEKTTRRKELLQSVRQGVWAASLLATLAAAFLGWQAWRQPARVEPLRATALTTLPGEETYPSLSPDGSQVVFTWTGPRNDNADIYVQRIGSGQPMRLTQSPRSDHNPVWSPNGRWIAFLRSEQLPPNSAPAGTNELRLIAPFGGHERKLVEIGIRAVLGNPKFLEWCPDSACLVVTDSMGDDQPDALYVVSVETGEKRRLTNPPLSTLGDSSPAISPDGRSLVFRRSRAGPGELHWLRLGKDLTAEGEPKPLTLSTLNAGYPAWMPNSKEILFSAEAGLWRLAVFGEKSDDRPERLPFVGENGVMPALSRDAKFPRLIYVSAFTDWNVWRLETDLAGKPSNPPAVFISSTKADMQAQFSPDGQSIVFSSNRTGKMEIWKADKDGANAIQLTYLNAIAAAPQWSPDSDLIVFQSNFEGNSEVYVIPSAGGEPRNVTNNPNNDNVPSFSIDGRWIYFASNRTGEYRLWKAAVSGGGAVQVTPGDGFRAIESADGRYIYYSDHPGSPVTLMRMEVSGGEPVTVLEGVMSALSFAVLEKGVYYFDGSPNDGRLRFFDFRTRASKTIADSLGTLVAPSAISTSQDGRTILYSRVDSRVQDLMMVDNFR